MSAKTTRTVTSRLPAALILTFACAWVIVLGAGIAPAQKLTPDASSYLDIARNFSRGEGFILKDNLYQSWIGPSRRALAYQQPGYPLLLSFLDFTRRPVRAAVLLNTVLAAASLVLFFLAWKNFLAPWKAALAVLPLACSDFLYIGYSYPLTEAFSLFLLAAALALLFHNERWIVPAGILLSLSLLVRTASVFGIIGIVVGVFLFRKENRFGTTLKICAAIFIPLFAFVAAGYLITGDIYPAYGVDARTFRMTRDFGGAVYEAAAPFLRFSGTVTPGIFAKMLYHNVLTHLFEIGSAIGWGLILFAAAGCLPSVKNEKRGASLRILFSFAASHIILLSFAFYFMHILEVDRYALTAFAVLGPLAVLGAERLAGQIRLNKSASAAVVVLVMALVTITHGYRAIVHYQKDAQDLLNPEVAATYITQPREWIARHTGPTDLIATNYVINGFIFDRPLITLPVDRQLTPGNLAAFMKIHNPGAVLIDRGNEAQPGWQSPDTLNFLQSLGYENRESNDRFLLFVRP